MLLLGTQVLCLRVTCVVFHCACSQCVHLAFIIATGVYRFRQSGKLCAENEGEYRIEANGKTFTFSDDGDTIRKLFIA